jgi:BNR repeat protein
MNSLNFRRTASISLTILLVSSLFVIVNNSISQASSSDEIAAASGANRFVVWSDKTPGNWEIFFRRSTDNGATWKPIVNLSNDPGTSVNPQISVSGSNVFVIWAQSTADNTPADVYFRRSTDNGVTWKPLVKITSGGVGAISPQMTISGSNVYVGWDQQNGEIYVRRSADNGVTWKPIFNLTNNPGPSTNQQIVATGANVYVIWLQRSAIDSSLTDVFFRRSTDNGVTWKAQVNISKSGQVRISPEMAVSGSNVHVFWSHLSGQGFIRTSTDNGATWKPAKNLSNSLGEPVYSMEVAASGSNVYIVFTKSVELEGALSVATCSGSHQSELQVAASVDNGVTWNSPVTISQTYTGCDLALIPEVVIAHGSNVYVAWHVGEFDYGTSYFRASNDGGVTWGKEFPLIAHRPGLDMAASGSSLYLVLWYGDVYFFRSLDNGVTLEPQKNLSNNKGRSNNAQFGI